MTRGGTVNQLFGGALIGLGSLLLAFGVFFGFFAWINDGAKAGIGVFVTAGAFGAALGVDGLALWLVGLAHRRRDPRRWWYHSV